MLFYKHTIFLEIHVLKTFSLYIVSMIVTLSDYVNGGELFTHLNLREHFTEKEVKIYIGEIVLALETLHKVRDYMSRAMRKPGFCLCENKDADQLRSNCEADQCLFSSPEPKAHR